MANPLDTALDTLFGSVLAEAVTYTGPDGVRSPASAIVTEPDVVTAFGQSRASQPATVFEIRKSELAQAERGGIIVRADDSRYRVTQALLKDSRRTIWSLEAAAIDN